MDSESSSTPPERKRRWFQFSLRTLLIVITAYCVFGGWIGHETAIARQREAVRKWIERQGGTCGVWPGHEGEDQPSFLRPCSMVDVPHSMSADDVELIREVFRHVNVRRF
jgi:hypothetical protein